MSDLKSCRIADHWSIQAPVLQFGNPLNTPGYININDASWNDAMTQAGTLRATVQAPTTWSRSQPTLFPHGSCARPCAVWFIIISFVFYFGWLLAPVILPRAWAGWAIVQTLYIQLNRRGNFFTRKFATLTSGCCVSRLTSLGWQWFQLRAAFASNSLSWSTQVILPVREYLHHFRIEYSGAVTGPVPKKSSDDAADYAVVRYYLITQFALTSSDLRRQRSI